MSTTDQPRGRDARIFAFATETPWAIAPTALYAIRELLVRHRAGGKLTDEEIREAVAEHAARPRTPAPRGGSVAVIPIRGVIVPHADLMTDISGGTSVDGFLGMLRDAMADDAVSAIVLDVDSPGGSVYGLREAAQEIRAARGRKRIIGVANYMAASAAYYLLAQASEVYVPESGQVGAVGTIAFREDISAALEMEGVKVNMISAGDHKDEEWPYAPMSDDERAAIQARIDFYYRQFREDVAKGRGVDVGKVEADFGQGRMLTGPSAKAAGMVDRLGTIEDAIRAALGGEPGRSRARAELPEVAPDPPVRVTENVTISGLGSAVASASSGASGALTFTHETRGAVAAQDVAATSGGATTTTRTPQKEGRTMHIDELVARRQEIEARMTELDSEYAGQQMPDAATEEFDALGDEHDEIVDALADIDRRRDRLSRVTQGASRVSGAERPRRVLDADGAGGSADHVRGGSRGSRLPENLFDITGYRKIATGGWDDLVGAYKEGATRAVEQLRFETDDQERAKEHVLKLLAKDTRDAAFARRVIVTGSSLYERAFAKQITQRPLSTHELAILSELQDEDGGIAVPITIDPTITLVSDGVVNPIRQLARTVTITGRHWRGLTSEGVVASYDEELEEVSDDSPELLAPEAEVEKAQVFVPFSIEIDQDLGALREFLAEAFRDAKDTLEADKFLFGTGPGAHEPQGLIDALTGTSSVIDTSATNDFDLVDIYAVKAALPPRFRARASWLASDDVYSVIRQFDTQGGGALWTQLASDRPERLIGKPVYEASGMSGVVDTGGELVMVYGDFSKFVIVDRAGLNVELVPHLFGASRRPIGARGLYAWWRNTSQVLSVNAFRMLRIEPS